MFQRNAKQVGSLAIAFKIKFHRIHTKFECLSFSLSNNVSKFSKFQTFQRPKFVKSFQRNTKQFCSLAFALKSGFTVFIPKSNV